ncbi:cytochrome ubiquinol oxidase subunit I [Streptosporangium sp. KLBMP 9127]|nr:cytochrome ubiquinol oxidase subunit I [Streptosporangium sp. KLBMP 9127]
METIDLARLQFALTAGGHFLFVALTLGLATLVAITQTHATFTGSPVHLRMTRFWGQLYVVNYAMGIVTGLVMEFQFGLNWSGLTHFAGNVFGGSLAMETLVAFFLESTFLALWIFGWGRLNRWAHLAAIWVVTLTAYASAYWILVSNGFMQNPVGFEVVDGVMRLTDAVAVLTNPAAIAAFGHVVSGGLLVGAVFMAGVSAYHLRRRTNEQELFRKSLRIGVFVTLPAVMVTATFGGLQFESAQEMKLAVWGRDSVEIAQLQAAMVATHGPGDYVPPAGWVQSGGMIMMIAFALLLFVAGPNMLLAFFPRVVSRFRLWHLLLTWMIPIPFVAMIAGWVFREMGRQPWVVYGELTTAEALSPLPGSQLLLSLAGFTTMFALIIVVNTWMLVRHARRAPETVALGGTMTPSPEPAMTL